MSYTNGLDKPSDYFNTVLWTGNGADRTITTDHATDWIWMKDRDQAIYHRLTDSVRGVAKVLFTNVTDAEQSDQYGTVGSFTSTGFTIRQGASNSNYVGANENNIQYVGWSWVGGGTASSNTDGSITSTVSANTTSGFSIVSYSGSGSDGSIGHGLNTSPAMVIIKNRTSSTQADWVTWHQNLSSGKNVFLNLTSAETTPSFGTITGVNSTVVNFTQQSGNQTSTSGHNYIAYCFAEKKGYSKFGSYVGNGSSDGSYIHLGFKPAFIIIKITSGTGNWVMYDNKINTENVMDTNFFPNLSNAEDEDTNHNLDFLSNGFKWRTTSGIRNGSGNQIIYMAFAESPFVTSTGIPTTAR